jgi:hypothetical protein
MNLGALGAEETRQSIPNLAVKLCYGDNTAGGAPWENSLVPGLSFSQNGIEYSLDQRGYQYK